MLRLISFNHFNLPLEKRERIAIDQTSISFLYRSLKDISGASEIFIISTCNRTEIYYISQEDWDIEFTKLILGGNNYSKIFEKSYRIKGFNSVSNHLFRVISGLESKVLGEVQIVNQVKSAYQISVDNQCAGPVVHRLLHTAFQVNKSVTTKTSLRQGLMSVSSIAVDKVKLICGDKKEERVVVIGYGETGRAVVESLLSKGYTNIVVLNRSLEKIDNPKIIACPLNKLDHHILASKVVISAISLNEPLVSSEFLNDLNIMDYRYFIDLSVPRAISPEIDEMPQYIRYDIDDLNVIASEAKSEREAAIPHAEDVISTYSDQFSTWCNGIMADKKMKVLAGYLEEWARNGSVEIFKSFRENDLAMPGIQRIMDEILQNTDSSSHAKCEMEDIIAKWMPKLYDLFSVEEIEELKIIPQKSY